MQLRNTLQLEPGNLQALTDPFKCRLAAWWIVLTQDADQPTENTHHFLRAAQEAGIKLATNLDQTELTELLNAGQIGQPFNLPFYRDEDELSELLDTEAHGPMRIEDRDHQPKIAEHLEAERLTRAYPEELLYQKHRPAWADLIPQILTGIEASASLYPHLNPFELQNKTIPTSL